jgi:hypothetical protein
MRLRTLVPALAFGVVLALAVPASAHAAPSWQLVPTGSSQQFRGLAAVSRSVAWLAGTSGTVLRTVDGGRHWSDVSPPGASALEFRDIEAWDGLHAVALTAGTGTDARVYRTADGGLSWQQAFTNDDPTAFYDCMAFFNKRDGLAVSDPVDGKFRLIATHDGGRTWALVDPAGMPAALPGEFGFAASGTCLITSGHQAWIASGGAAVPRVFHSRDFGRTWTVADTPVIAGGTAGIYSLAAWGGTARRGGGRRLHGADRACRRGGIIDGRRAVLATRSDDARRVPLGCGVRRAAHPRRGRADRFRRLDRCRAHVDDVRHRLLRHRAAWA